MTYGDFMCSVSIISSLAGTIYDRIVFDLRLLLNRIMLPVNWKVIAIVMREDLDTVNGNDNNFPTWKIKSQMIPIIEFSGAPWTRDDRGEPEDAFAIELCGKLQSHHYFSTRTIEKLPPFPRDIVSCCLGDESASENLRMMAQPLNYSSILANLKSTSTEFLSPRSKFNLHQKTFKQSFGRFFIEITVQATPRKVCSSKLRN